MRSSRVSRPPAARRGATTRAGVPVAAAIVAGILGILLWGFTVDDALITGRYAHHIATGDGYVFNRGGPSTDGVTPLGFAYLLAPFARGGAWDALVAAKVLGLVAHAAGAAFVAWAVASFGGSRWRWSGPAAWLVAAPAAAWSVAGLETGFVVGLVAIGASLRATGRADGAGVSLLGVAAGLRPELLPMVCVLSFPRPGGEPAVRGPAPEHDAAAADAAAADAALRRELALGARVPLSLDARAWARLALAVGPFLSVAAIRLIAFGRAAPLSAQAKPADLRLGLAYVGACAILTGVVGVLAPLAIARGPRYGRWLVAGVVTHMAAIAFAGGDWMPVSRLFAPVLPVIALAVGALASASRAPWIAARAALALAGEAYAWWTVGAKLPQVTRDRAALIEQMREPLREAQVVAGLDVGWLGAAAPHATIVDLAGVTDPEIAALPGRHIEKKIPDGLLEARGTDTLVLQIFRDAPVVEPWPRTPFARGIEVYIATEPGLDRELDPVFVSEGKLRYVVLRRRATPRELEQEVMLPELEIDAPGLPRAAPTSSAP